MCPVEKCIKWSVSCRELHKVECMFAVKVKDEELEQQKKIDEAINLIGRLISEGKKPSVW